MKVLVTGGSGFLGKRLKISQPNWEYISSKDFDLTNFSSCMDMLSQHKPDAVLHLAARVGGIKDNVENPAEFFYQNVSMNTNIVHACYQSKISRLLACLSTCIFPDKLENYPFHENDIFKGPPTESNFSYGYSKRALLVQINAYRKQYGLNYSTFCPSNLYGPDDNFNNDKSHFVPAMIKKLVDAKEKDTVTFWGTGTPLRQQLYVDDLVEFVPKLLEQHNTSSPIIISPDENLSISEMINSCLSILNKNINVQFNQALDGQYRKDGANIEFKKLFPNSKFTSFEEGLKKTIKWYMKKKQQ